MLKKKMIYIGCIVFILGISSVFAQTPPPPNDGNTGNGGGVPVGGGAPIGSGLLILMGLGAVYAGKKIEKSL